MTAKIDDEAAWYEAQEERWEVVEALLGGTEKMRECTEYLPQFAQEPDTDYRKRLQNSTLTNFYLQIAQRMMGLVFRERVQVIDSKIDEAILNNIDNKGRDIHAFAEYIGFYALTRGLHHILIDVPINTGTETLADDKVANIRPFWVSIPAKSAFSAFAETVANQEILKQVRYKNDTAELEGWAIKKVCRISVLKLDENGAGFETWVRREDAGEYELDVSSGGVFKASGGAPLRMIPWVPVYGGRRDGFLTCRSVIQDIAYKNVEHWQSASDQRNILTVCRYPMHYQIGTKDPIKARGPHIVLHSPGRTSDKGQDVEFGYVEPEGRAIEAGERDLERLVKEAEMLAIQLRVNPTQTATGAQIDQSSTTSNLVTFAHAIEHSLNEALKVTAAFLGIAPEDAGRVVVNKDFTITAEEAERAKALIEMSKNGKLSDLTLWEQMYSMGYLDGDFDAEREKERLGANDLVVPPGAM